jgi:hypothetical protein
MFGGFYRCSGAFWSTLSLSKWMKHWMIYLSKLEFNLMFLWFENGFSSDFNCFLNFNKILSFVGPDVRGTIHLLFESNWMVALIKAVNVMLFSTSVFWSLCKQQFLKKHRSIKHKSWPLHCLQPQVILLAFWQSGRDTCLLFLQMYEFCQLNLSININHIPVSTLIICLVIVFVERCQFVENPHSSSFYFQFDLNYFNSQKIHPILSLFFHKLTFALLCIALHCFTLHWGQFMSFKRFLQIIGELMIEIARNWFSYDNSEHELRMRDWERWIALPRVKYFRFIRKGARPPILKLT